MYVRPFPVGSGKWRVSNGKGVSPRWSTDGRRIYFVRGDEIHATSISTDGGKSVLTVGREEKLLTVNGLTNFDVSPVGNTMVKEQQSVGVLPDKLHIVLNWSEEVRKKTATR